MGPTRPETSVNNYHTTPRNTPEERRSHQHRGGRLKSRRVHDSHIVIFFVSAEINVKANEKGVQKQRRNYRALIRPIYPLLSYGRDRLDDLQNDIEWLTMALLYSKNKLH
jgi:hypothetical protein